MTLKFKTLALILTSSLFNLTVAATWTWTGAVSNNWETKANWSTVSASIYPQSGDNVIINSGAVNQPTLSNSRTINNLTINGGTLDTRNRTLTISRTLFINGGSAVNSQNSSTGNITVDTVYVNSNSPFSIVSNGTLLLNVVDRIHFINGTIVSNSSDLVVLRDNAIATGASNPSHVNGPVRKIGNDAFTFPIGNGTVYAPIGISDFSNSSVSQYTTVSYSQIAPVGSLTGGGNISDRENWSFVRSNASQTSKITMFYDANLRSGGISDSNDLALAVYNGTTWSPINSIVSGSANSGSLTTVTRVSGSIQSITLSSPIGLNALPIELINFSAKSESSKVLINWSTVNEINNDHFNVEKSIDGKNWSVISTVKGSINSSSVLAYESTDVNPVKGIQYYRLKQTDINGSITYSEIVVMNFDLQVKLAEVYPNPARDLVNINLLNDNGSTADIRVLNAMGMTVITLNAQSGIISLDLSNLETGVYTIELVMDAEVEQIKLAKN